MDKEAQQTLAQGICAMMVILSFLLGVGGCWHLARTGDAKQDAIRLQRDIWQAQQEKAHETLKP